jgi:hypothetical protein
LDDLTRKPINEINSCKKSFIPEFQRHRCICKEGQTNFNNVPMFALSRAILLMSMRTGNKVRDTNLLKKRI